MPQVGYLLYHFEDTAEFGEPLPTGPVMPLPTESLILKAIYLTDTEVSLGTLYDAGQRLRQRHSHLLRIVPSPDGPPFRLALVYVHSGGEEVTRVGDWRLPQSLRTRSYMVQATRYVAVRMGSSYSWESDATLGRQGYFLTGISGPSALWRVGRVEGDALDRQLVALSPVRLPHPIAAPNFDKVAEPLQAFLRQHFEEFQKAVGRNAYLDVVNRASSLAEGIMEYSLTLAGRAAPSTLAARIGEARKVALGDDRPATFPLTGYGIALAERIRVLHQRTHADRAIQGHHLRPEVGMSAAIDVSELMIEAGLGHY